MTASLDVKWPFLWGLRLLVLGRMALCAPLVFAGQKGCAWDLPACRCRRKECEVCVSGWPCWRQHSSQGPLSLQGQQLAV